jgi:hypothetical protein
MTPSRRWRWLLFIGASSSMLITILWAAHLFLAIHLRIRTARELAARSETLHTVSLAPVSQPVLNSAAICTLALFDERPALADIVRRVQELQRPSPRMLVQHLFRRKETPAQPQNNPAVAQGQLLVGLSPQGQLLASNASDSTAQLWDVATGVQQPITEIAVNVTTAEVATTVNAADPGVAIAADGSGSLGLQTTVAGALTFSLRAIANRWVWHGDPSDPRSFAITDSAGEKLWLVTQPCSLGADMDGDGVSDMSDAKQELLVIDTGGNIIGRFASPVGILLGRLQQPYGKADQLVFGPASSLRAAANDEWLASGPATVCIIERGRLRVVSHVPAPDAATAEATPAEQPSFEVKE